MDTIGMSAIKYILFIFNLIFSMSGIAIIAVGALVMQEMGQFSHFLESRILTLPIILIVAGSIVFLIAFLGCFGAIKENFLMLIAFAVALLIIFLIEMGIGIAAAVFINDFKDIMKKSLRDSMLNNSDADKEAWNNIQNVLGCCGVDSKDDWYTIIPDGRLPKSCCSQIENNEQSSMCRANSANVYEKSCFDLLEMKVTANAKLLTGIGIGIAFVEVAGIILACCLAMAIRRENNK